MYIYNKNIEFKYYNIKQTGFFLRKAKNNMRLMHYNMRSLPKTLCMRRHVLGSIKVTSHDERAF